MVNYRVRKFMLFKKLYDINLHPTYKLQTAAFSNFRYLVFLVCKACVADMTELPKILWPKLYTKSGSLSFILRNFVLGSLIRCWAVFVTICLIFW